MSDKCHWYCSYFPTWIQSNILSDVSLLKFSDNSFSICIIEWPGWSLLIYLAPHIQSDISRDLVEQLSNCNQRDTKTLDVKVLACTWSKSSSYCSVSLQKKSRYNMIFLLSSTVSSIKLMPHKWHISMPNNSNMWFFWLISSRKNVNTGYDAEITHIFFKKA